MTDYNPFGAEWELEMLKFKKQDLVEMLRAALKNNFTRIEKIKDVLYCDECSDKDKIAGIKLIINNLEKENLLIAIRQELQQLKEQHNELNKTRS